MIRLVSNGKDLDLYSSTQIEMNMRSHLFNEKGFIPGIYSVPFDIPLTDSNKQELDYPGEISNHKKFKANLPITIYMEQAVYNKGLLQVTGVSGSKVRATINIGLGSLGDEFKEQKINELSDVQVDMLGASGVEKWAEFANYATNTPYFMEVTINGETFQGNSLTDTAHAATDLRNNINASTDYSATSVGIFVKVYPKIKTDFDAPLSVTLTGTFPQVNTIFTADYLTDYYNEILPYLGQYLTGTPPDDAFVFPIIQNYFHNQEESSFNYWPTVNQTVSGVYEKSRRSFVVQQEGRFLMPCIKWMHVFRKIEEKFDVKFKGSLFTNPDFQSLIWIQKDQYVQTQDEFFPGTFRHLRFRNLLDANATIPDLKISEFLQSIINTFNAAISYDPTNQSIIIDSRSDAITATEIQDISSISSEFTDLKNQENNGYEFSVSSKVQNTIPENSTVSVGNGINKIKSIYNSLPKRFATILPEQFPAVSRQYEIEENEKAYQYLFNKGNPVNPQGFIYPQANNESASFDLKWPDANGLFAKNWEPWVRFLINSNTSTRNINFSILDLSNFDFTKKRKIQESTYLMKDVVVLATMSGIKISKCTPVRVDTHANENTRVNP